MKFDPHAAPFWEAAGGPVTDAMGRLRLTKMRVCLERWQGRIFGLRADLEDVTLRVDERAVRERRLNKLTRISGELERRIKSQGAKPPTPVEKRERYVWSQQGHPAGTIRRGSGSEIP